MNLGSKSYKAILGLSMLLLLVGSGQMQKALNRDRTSLGLTRLPALENAPPILAFTTVALGGFRGLIANALWIRASDLQEQDKYFEMVQLADWITKLEPHYIQVWLVQSWNMAYNISVKFPAASDRWRWVKRGIELLRDEGLKYNPDEPLIYRELAWFFQHKMGANLDDAQLFYKKAWAHEMNPFFGPHPDFTELLNPTTETNRENVRILKEKYKMDPVVIKEVDDKYGPLDWRLPEAHAIYWGYLGLAKSKPEDLIVLRRVIFQSMQLAFQRGAIVQDKMGGSPDLGPNLDFMENANKAFEDMMAADPERKFLITTGHKNFLLNGPYYLYLYNRRREADRWYQYLLKTYPDAVPKGTTLDQYAVMRVTEVAGETDVDKNRAAIGGLLYNYFIDLIQDEDDRAVNYERLAQAVWNQHQNRIGADQLKRVGLPPFAQIKQQVLGELLDPERGLQPQFAAVLRTRLGLPAAAPKAAPAETNKP